MVDASVVGAARVGSEWALTALYRDIQPGLLRYLAVRAPGEHEDIAADVWIETARALPTFEGDADGLRRLIFTIARRRTIDHHRKRFRRRTTPVPHTALDDRATSPSGEDVVVGAAQAAWALAKIREWLPAEQAEIVLLRVVSGMSTAEIAEVIGRRPAAVSVLQHRALRRLARHAPPDDFWGDGARSGPGERRTGRDATQPTR